MQLYTVLLLRPDHVADTFGHDTFMDYVTAADPAAAVKAAQERAAETDQNAPADYHVLMVAAGKVEDIKEQADEGRTIGSLPLTEAEHTQLIRHLMNVRIDTGSNLTARVADSLIAKLRAMGG